jgi:hypothetical protein
MGVWFFSVHNCDEDYIQPRSQLIFALLLLSMNAFYNKLLQICPTKLVHHNLIIYRIYKVFVINDHKSLERSYNELFKKQPGYQIIM